jgi:hypothetical protein
MSRFLSRSIIPIVAPNFTKSDSRSPPPEGSPCEQGEPNLRGSPREAGGNLQEGGNYEL